MHASLLNVLHDRADYDFFTVTNGVDIHLNRCTEKTVQQHRSFIGSLHCVAHIAQQVFLTIDDLHGTTTEHIGRPHYQRITNGLGRLYCCFSAAHRRIVRLLQLQLLYHFLETLTILRSVDRIRRRAYNGHAMSLQCPCELERGLATKLHNHTLGLL